MSVKSADTLTVAVALEKDAAITVLRWLERVHNTKELTDVTLADRDRAAYLVGFIEQIVTRLRKIRVLEAIAIPSNAAVAHGQLRYRQGYDAPMLVQESRILQVCLFETIQRNLSRMDFNFVLPDVMLIADEVDAQLTQIIDSFLKSSGLGNLYKRKAFRNAKLPDEIIGRSEILRSVLKRAAIVADTDSTVLLTGETGTGKERVARLIHETSRRAGGPFIKMNCAAIPTGLLESELFGHERGAFTGALGVKQGRLELANGGTLLLDEIGDIALELQPKLLRVLQDQEFERLGSNRTIHVDVRIIAATNLDLAQAVEERRFRADLFYRLHVFPVHMPALRDRREDIPLLVRYFVDRFAAQFGKPILTIPDGSLEVMKNWRWPGNIRELENFIERSVILSPTAILNAPLVDLLKIDRGRDEMSDSLGNAERDHILKILRGTRGVLSGPLGAACRLGLKRTTLQYRMQKLRIARLDYLN